MRNRIEEYRKPLGLSQHRLSKKVGVSRTSSNHIETEKTIPSLKLAKECKYVYRLDNYFYMSNFVGSMYFCYHEIF